MAEEPRYTDPFSPTLQLATSVTPYAVQTEEQQKLITDVLNLSSSDSRFAQKALAAIQLILAGGSLSPIPPVINTVEPNTGANGTINLKVKCKGTGFDSTCIISINGVAQPTSFTSSTEVFTNWTISGGAGPRSFTVKNGAGVVSNTAIFTVT